MHRRRKPMACRIIPALLLATIDLGNDWTQSAALMAVVNAS